MTASEREPVLRPEARVLLFDARDRILLFRLVDPTDAGFGSLWITVGGAVEAGESHEQAARRELWEETGLELEPGPCVWLRDATYRWQRRWYRSMQRFYIARTEHTAISTANMPAREADQMPEHRWWSAAEIEASAERFAPRRLGALLAPLLAGELPDEPVTVERDDPR